MVEWIVLVITYQFRSNTDRLIDHKRTNGKLIDELWAYVQVFDSRLV
jgi:hypothetical protein